MTSIPVIRSHTNEDLHKASHEFLLAYGAAPEFLIHAPYRICPLGAHVDHQFGAVAACAIDHGVTLAITPLDTPHIRLKSLAFEASADFAFASCAAADRSSWEKHARGAVVALEQAHGFELRRGFQGVIVGTRAETGLSSSAACGVAYLMALDICNDLGLDQEALIRADGEIEQTYLALKNGLLDPAAVVYGRRNKLAVIDTRACRASHVDSSGAFRFLAVHSGLRKALTPENFNRRVEESRAAARSIARITGRFEQADIQANDLCLGDLTADDFALAKDKLDDIHVRRAQHFFSETARVREAAQSWQANDAQGLGRLMTNSAQSSIENYECGVTEVRDLVALLNETPGVYGARFCGPGFRGCSLALVDPARLDEVVEHVSASYGALHPQLAAASWILECRIEDGARIL